MPYNFDNKSMRTPLLIPTNTRELPIFFDFDLAYADMPSTFNLNIDAHGNLCIEGTGRLLDHAQEDPLYSDYAF